MARCRTWHGIAGPIGSRAKAVVLLDEELAAQPSLHCGAGEQGWCVDISGAVLAAMDGTLVTGIHAATE